MIAAPVAVSDYRHPLGPVARCVVAPSTDGNRWIICLTLNRQVFVEQFATRRAAMRRASDIGDSLLEGRWAKTAETFR